MFEKIILKSKENSELLTAVIQAYIYEKTHLDNIVKFERNEFYYISIDAEFFDYAAYAFAAYLTENICLFFIIDLLTDFENDLSDIEKELLTETLFEQLSSSEGESLRLKIAEKLVFFSKEYDIINIDGFVKFAIKDCVTDLCDLFCDAAFSFILYDRFYYIELIDNLRNMLKNNRD